MAGTIIANTLNTDTVGGVFTANNAITGIAKAWVNYKGTATQSIRGSYNVSSVTVNGTGDYTINFTTALVDANYSCVLTGATSTARIVAIHDTGAAPTSSACRVLACNTSGVASDVTYLMAVVLAS